MNKVRSLPRLLIVTALALTLFGEAGRSQDGVVSAIKIVGTKEQFGQDDGTFSAEVPPQYAAFSLSLGGAGVSQEAAKCVDLVEVAGSDLAAIFDNAVSSLTVVSTLSESRGDEQFGRQWQQALSAITKDFGVEFDIPDKADYVPSVSELTVDVTRSLFTDSRVGEAASVFLEKRYAAMLQDAYVRQADTFRSSGIVRLETDDQAAVCYAALVSSFELVVRVRARTFDRIRVYEFLDRACVQSTLNSVNERFAARTAPVDGGITSEAFLLVFGLEIALSSKRESGWFGEAQENLCVLEGSADLFSNRPAREAWSKVASAWYAFSVAAGHLAVSASELDGMSGYGREVQLLPMMVSYQYTLTGAGGR